MMYDLALSMVTPTLFLRLTTLYNSKVFTIVNSNTSVYNSKVFNRIKFRLTQITKHWSVCCCGHDYIICFWERWPLVQRRFKDRSTPGLQRAPATSKTHWPLNSWQSRHTTDLMCARQLLVNIYSYLCRSNSINCCFKTMK